MTNISIYNSTPRTVFRGIDDQGAVNIAMPVDSVPIRFPLFINFSPTGSYTDPIAVNGSTIGLTHGGDVLRPSSKFFNHQSVFMRSHFNGAGSAIFLRLKADGSAMSSLRLGIDVVLDELETFTRNPDGTYKRDINGALVPTGETKPIYRAQFRVMQIPDDLDGQSTFGKAAASEGALVSGTGESSTFYPIQDFLGRWDGDLGNHVGFRLSAPSTLDRTPLDADLVDRLKARPYRLQVVSRASDVSAAQTFPTLSGESSMDFTFIDAVDPARGYKEYNIARTLMRTYESEKPEEFTGYGPFSEMHVYTNHLETVLTLLAAAEAEETLEPFDNIHLFNFVTGSDINEVPYHTYRVEGPRDGGILLSDTSSHFLKGGSDGDISTAALNRKWDDLLSGIQTSEIPFEDYARMPYDVIFDSGFPMETKLKFVAFHNLRADTYPHVCTQDVTTPLNTPSEDSSAGLTIRSAFRSMIESPEFGTKSTRFAVANGAGYFADDDYTGMVPFMEYIASKGANYMGAANGRMDPEKTFGRGENNVVTRYVRHNGGIKPLLARNKDWLNGVNYPEFYDMKRMFYAGIQSIHEDHTSPLHSYFNVQICCNLTRIGSVVWRELSGDDQLDDQTFLTEVERRIRLKTHEIYDGRCIVTPRAYYTALDTDLGTHWHLDIEVQFRNIKTVQVLAVVSQRMRTEETA